MSDQRRFRWWILVLIYSLVFATFAQPPLRPLAIDTFRPVIRGTRAVVAGGHPLVTEAGMRMLHRGGNAVDAGVAAVLAASVIEFSHFAFGGEVPVIIKPANKPVIVINGQGTAPALATREFFEKRAADLAKKTEDHSDNLAGLTTPIPTTGPLAATVPGVLDAMIVALDNFGTMHLGDVLAPAIELAEAFPIDELRVNYIRNTRKVFEQWPSSRAVFLPHGEVPEVGDLFVQKDLAGTLRELAEVEKKNLKRGRHAALEAARDYFYRGPLAQRYCAAIEEAGGLLRAGDLAAFHAEIEQPV
ncbi:MAG: gamma-glutamyltransferase, partial [Blastocatellia bacterium]|nr:gamma-glutamyltransferase [Blastocatellia bacterium]